MSLSFTSQQDRSDTYTNGLKWLAYCCLPSERGWINQQNKLNLFSTSLLHNYLKRALVCLIELFALDPALSQKTGHHTFVTSESFLCESSWPAWLSGAKRRRIFTATMVEVRLSITCQGFQPETWMSPFKIRLFHARTFLQERGALSGPCFSQAQASPGG